MRNGLHVIRISFLCLLVLLLAACESPSPTLSPSPTAKAFPLPSEEASVAPTQPVAPLPSTTPAPSLEVMMFPSTVTATSPATARVKTECLGVAPRVSPTVTLTGTLILNGYPNIWVTQEGLIITAFLFRRISIPWTEIVDTRHGHIPTEYTLVRARKISFAHRISGLLYSRSFYPSFLITSKIDGYEQLVREIEARVRKK